MTIGNYLSGAMQRRRRTAIVGALLGAMCLAPALAIAQDAPAADPAAPAAAPSDEQVAAGLVVWKDRGGCANCHGNFGEGGEGGHFPAGPSLRRSTLDLATIHEVIACGLPGTLMPYNAEGAYDTRACYGIEGDKPPAEVTPGAALAEQEIDDLMAYLQVWVVGQRPRVTLAQCTYYYGDANDPNCVGLR